MQIEFIQSSLLLLTMGIAFIISKSFLASYDIFITAGVFIIYYFIKKLISIKDNEQNIYRVEFLRLTDSAVFTYIVIVIVNSTGGLSSPLYFLNYFLIFALSLILEPIISVAATIGLVIMYILSIPANSSIKELLPLFALPFLTPFALFLGQEHIKNVRLKAKNEKLKNKVSDHQKNTFLFLSLVLKNHIKAIRDSVDNFIGDEELSDINRHAREMEKAIEKYESP